MNQDRRTDWGWLADTYWYVTKADLPALQFDNGQSELSWRVDQTVWHVAGYRNGYLWGVTAAMVVDAGEEVPTRGPRSRPSHLALLGTVTPTGKVQLTFIPSGLMGSVTMGLGQMVERGGGWVFEMQMSTEGAGGRVLHWANMVQTREGEESWSRLPGVGWSVPAMLEGAVYPTMKGT